MSEPLQIRIHGDVSLPTLVYLPGVHGDWTLVAGFRAALQGKVRFVEFTYPRTISWTLEDYARSVQSVLVEHQIKHGWLLGESFGSQVVWAMFAQNEDRECQNEEAASRSFQADGIILAGGFVCYPFKSLVSFAKRILVSLPPRLGRIFCRAYLLYARARFRKSPETMANVNEFVARRTPEDMAAIVHRLDIIAANDLSDIASRVRVPVFQLSGGIDPVVPMLSVRSWLKKNCPRYYESKMICLADHNVLGTAPSSAASIVMEWISCRSRSSKCAALSRPSDF